MEIINLDSVDSTHSYLKNYIKTIGYKNPICVVTTHQTNGIGSRGNTWNGKKGNLFFSFAINLDNLPKDLQLQSSSIYFSFLLCKILQEKGSNIWLKWPNDFYIDEKKIGGTITNLTNNILLCGIGLNINKVSDEFGFLDIKIDINNVLNDYFKLLENKVSWKQIFSCYKLEFQKSKKLKSTIEGQKVSLAKATLNDDGSISINNKKVYSLR